MTASEHGPDMAIPAWPFTPHKGHLTPGHGVKVTLLAVLVGVLCGMEGARAQTELSSTHTARADTSTSLPEPPDIPVQHIGGMFEVENFTSLSLLFNQSVRKVNESLADRQSAYRFGGMTLPALRNVHNVIIYICDAIIHYNVTAFVAVGSQHIINTLTMVTRQTGTPLLAYVTEPAPVAVTVSSNSYPTYILLHSFTSNAFCQHFFRKQQAAMTSVVPILSWRISFPCFPCPVP